jgi:hypothetical protein
MFQLSGSAIIRYTTRNVKGERPVFTVVGIITISFQKME